MSHNPIIGKRKRSALGEDVLVLLSPTTGAVQWTLEEDGEDIIDTRGTWIERGSVFLALESCKMEIPIVAPEAGFCKYFVAPGEVVSERSLLAELTVVVGEIGRKEE